VIADHTIKPVSLSDLMERVPFDRVIVDGYEIENWFKSGTTLRPAWSFEYIGGTFEFIDLPVVPTDGLFQFSLPDVQGVDRFFEFMHSVYLDINFVKEHLK
jgi:hypothetical protein